MVTKKEVNVPPQTVETTEKVQEANVAPVVEKDQCFAENIAPNFKQSLLRDFGQEITFDSKEGDEYAEIVNEFQDIFDVNEGFRFFVNTKKASPQRGYPFTVLVPTRFSDLDVETMSQVGAYRTSFFLPSLSYLNVKEALKSMLQARAAIIKYQKRR